MYKSYEERLKSFIASSLSSNTSGYDLYLRTNAPSCYSRKNSEGVKCFYFYQPTQTKIGLDVEVSGNIYALIESKVHGLSRHKIIDKKSEWGFRGDDHRNTQSNIMALLEDIADKTFPSLVKKHKQSSNLLVAHNEFQLEPEITFIDPFRYVDEESGIEYPQDDWVFYTQDGGITSFSIEGQRLPLDILLTQEFEYMERQNYEERSVGQIPYDQLDDYSFEVKNFLANASTPQVFQNRLNWLKFVSSLPVDRLPESCLSVVESELPSKLDKMLSLYCIMNSSDGVVLSADTVDKIDSGNLHGLKANLTHLRDIHSLPSLSRDQFFLITSSVYQLGLTNNRAFGLITMGVDFNQKPEFLNALSGWLKNKDDAHALRYDIMSNLSEKLYDTYGQENSKYMRRQLLAERHFMLTTDDGIASSWKLMDHYKNKEDVFRFYRHALDAIVVDMMLDIPYQSVFLNSGVIQVENGGILQIDLKKINIISTLIINDRLPQALEWSGDLREAVKKCQVLYKKAYGDETHYNVPEGLDSELCFNIDSCFSGDKVAVDPSGLKLLNAESEVEALIKLKPKELDYSPYSGGFLELTRSFFHESDPVDIAKKSKFFHEYVSPKYLDKRKNLLKKTAGEDFSWPKIINRYEENNFSIESISSYSSLLEEAESHQHCCLLYYQDCKKGRTFLLSVKENGRRVGTVEIGITGVQGSDIYPLAIRVKQFLGYKNKEIKSDAANAFLSTVKQKIEHGEIPLLSGKFCEGRENRVTTSDFDTGYVNNYLECPIFSRSDMESLKNELTQALPFGVTLDKFISEDAGLTNFMKLVELSRSTQSSRLDKKNDVNQTYNHPALSR
ncbi:hypothetical protein [Photobacterium leiognathi]|uniref:hypothetical protein n=1 Tax=Photobacterium leiognathi TaxID=553611 RepID=UPI0029813C61|nr:hypothetical protein [Photobacterium leiognathi]